MGTPQRRYPLEPATVTPSHWPCGHERTRDNTQSIGRGGQVRCRLCRRVTARESAARRRAQGKRPSYLSREVRDAIVTLTARGLAPAEIAERLRL